MTLATMIQALDGRVAVLERQGDLDVSVTAITDDSRKAASQCLFVAVKGEHVDGHRFIPAALKGGVSALVVQEAVRGISLPFVRVEDSRRALGLLGSRFYGDPSNRIRMIGITGTNGKTTTTYVCKALLEGLGRQVGLIGTVAYQIGTRTMPAAHTTPGALELQRLLAEMASCGCGTAVMEVSSHALAQDRTSGCEYDVGVFSNLTQDHLDFHKTMENYFQAKLRLFTGLGEGRKKNKRAIINIDDPYGSQIVARSPVPVWTYALKSKADLLAEDVQLSIRGTTFTAATPVGTFPIESHLVGEHNVYNLLAAIGVALHEGATPDQIRQAVRNVLNVPGRFERVMAGQPFTVVVDYAHTEDALVRLLTAAEVLKSGRIITVFGCGGDRDRGKRPKMGAAAVRYSDVVILTSDNPRTEDPHAILDQVEVGVIEGLRQRSHVRYRKIADRRQAIEEAVREAHDEDMVLIAGKGHEDYQIVGTEKLHFDDREVARDAIQRVGVRL
ncbi:MAG: UDP-N-acetylmuramoyl-L-alanyl-D-glutamate--2,6-diaminopimelate ligase [Nitrospira sp.]|nr:UDP-N-acetylmuramoyl-L-alanyl-D-glutamate--2,6-diaminopimelate ligase [Nitrospira sp.]MDH4242455.1 UDP-N-acetylmuramoyl-L-alanyl-D-glutamate--2,6-diaminopimelate ligase [Nitrospira sp.]MDH4355361.1 UDP-N-acetylmuramoyl-L-alanyl-D-glutamate--2,6-diaminopimelate ligase [Nitrospira sp.]MDH5318892.1 UDP-N-acetylmuramoyl-L-alanyl-D-glutamate--2,6-diaminopimelate ligase [Nitrospira sp.]